jgi:hypothetical protein
MSQDAQADTFTEVAIVIVIQCYLDESFRLRLALNKGTDAHRYTSRDFLEPAWTKFEAILHREETICEEKYRVMYVIE